MLAGVASLWAGSFALDQTFRSHFRNMSSSDADLLQHVSYASVGVAAASLYIFLTRLRPLRLMAQSK